MREAIGGTWLTQLVIIFMLIFVAFLALSLNYTKAFKVKNELLTIIEKYEGATDTSNGSIAVINGYLKANNYGTVKGCPTGGYGVPSLDTPTIKKAEKGQKYYYCISKVKSPTKNNPNKVFYKLNIFFYFNLPVIGDIFKFDVSGTTNDIARPADNLEAREEISIKGGY